MDKEIMIWIFVLAAVITLFAVFTAVYQNIKTRKILNSINRMIEQAMNGDFTEQDIDESLLSEVECKMAKYLSASELSAKNVAIEKQTLNSLISNISHQTKTPLSNIKLYAELLRETELQDEAADNVRQLCTQTEKLEFLIESLVKMSRLETGILKLQPERQNIRKILSEIDKTYSGMAKEKGLELRINYCDAYAVFDEKWTVEAIGNIVDNAIKYTAQGSVSINVIEYKMFQCIEIQDTGRGIAEAEQGGIFTRFYRSEASGHDEGVGIGLYLTRQIITQEDGYIKVISELGKGSKFYVYLPASL